MASRRSRTANVGVVTRVEQLTPNMVRVAIGGEGLAPLTIGEYTDHYVKIVFPRPGVDYPEPFDLGVVRETMPQRDVAGRTHLHDPPLAARMSRSCGSTSWCTATRASPGRGRLNARPGDTVRFMGPGGGYAPEPDGGLAPAGRGRERTAGDRRRTGPACPPGRRVKAFIEVANDDEEQKLETAADPRSPGCTAAPPGRRRAVEAVRALEFPAGRRARVRARRGQIRQGSPPLPAPGARHPARPVVHLGYWRRGLNEDGWQSCKREWNQQVEREQDS